MNKDDILSILHGVIHPETSTDIVSSGVVRDLKVSAETIELSLIFARGRDPFANSIKKQIEYAIGERFPDFKGKIKVNLADSPTKASSKPTKGSHPNKDSGNREGIKKILAISSAKGGVGKSTVAANLALELARKGKKVAILDADIYGPSQHILFGVEDYVPTGEKVDGLDMIYPAESMGVKIMSIGFFIHPGDALVWRGPMATNALNQMIRQTVWGELDYLLIDLPPGTGDVHLSIISELTVDAAIIVSTPQKIALADVIRGINMYRGEAVAIPVIGIVENMAWFTPAELPQNKYYIFGQGGAKELALKEGIELLAQIPLMLNSQESLTSGGLLTKENSIVSNYYKALAERIINVL